MSSRIRTSVFRSAACSALAVVTAVPAMADVFNMPLGQRSLDFVTVGDSGNSSDATVNTNGLHLGAVNYPYSIGKYEVTSSQYAQFLNAKDPTGANALGLYYDYMYAYSGIGHNSTAASGNRYFVLPGSENRPATDVTWYSAIRFTNWLDNGQGNGDTETGTYTLGPLAAKRRADKRFEHRSQRRLEICSA